MTGAANRTTCAHVHHKSGTTWRDQDRYDAACAAYTAAEEALALTLEDADHALWQTLLQVHLQPLQAHYWLAQTPTTMFGLIETIGPAMERYGTPTQRAALAHNRLMASQRRDRSVVSAEVIAYARPYLQAVHDAHDTGAAPAAPRLMSPCQPSLSLYLTET